MADAGPSRDGSSDGMAPAVDLPVSADGWGDGGGASDGAGADGQASMEGGASHDVVSDTTVGIDGGTDGRLDASAVVDGGTDVEVGCDIVPDRRITYADAARITREQFEEMCRRAGGWIEVHPHCGGANTCRGFSYDETTGVYTEHTCAGLSTCTGYTCVLPDGR